MRGASLRFRLAAAGAAAVVAALALAAVGLAELFERHVTRRALAELSVHLDQLAAGLEQDADGGLILARPPADPRFRRPLSGLYWQIEYRQIEYRQIEAGDRVLRSRSLWDSALPLPEDVLRDGVAHEHLLSGPGGATLLTLEREVTLPPRLGGRTVRAAVALDRAEVVAAARAFVRDLAPYLGLLAGVLIAAGWVQLAVGLRPLTTVGARVAAVRSGRAARLGDDFPAEVRPLVGELDALIAAREAEIERARAQAADLAHGLKTPLQALMGQAGRLRAAGDGAAADGVEEVALAMRRAVDRELARARAAATRNAAADPRRVMERILAVLRRAPDGDRVAWRIDGWEDVRVRIDPDDLTEALGAVMENAARHAAAAVTLSVSREARSREDGSREGGGREDERAVIAVRDDGPGVPPERLAGLTGRGVRLDRRPGGSGLGLAIATDMVEAAGGDLTVRNVEPGRTVKSGLEVRLALPLSPTDA